jgi:hypothetical protein
MSWQDRQEQAEDQTTDQAILYTIEPITPRLVKVKPNCNKWNLGHQTAEAIAKNAIPTEPEVEFTAVAICVHPALPDQTYYLEDARTPHGWRVSDCTLVPKAENTYKILKGGEFTHDLARKLKLDEGELCEHNSITPGWVEGGTELHLPYAIEKKQADTIGYTIYDEVKTYHVTRAEGARKYSFENLKSWRDIKNRQVGSTAPRFKNIRIKGEAMLEFTEPDSKGNTVKCGFYLQETEVEPGTGRVVKPIGYPFEFLEAGEAPLTASKHPSVADIEATLKAIEPIEPPDAEFVAADNYIPFEQGVESFVLLRAVTANELDGKRWQKLLPKESEFTFGGTVTLENGNKFGILEKLRRDENLYFGVPWNSSTVMLATEFDRLHPEDEEPIAKYEATPPDTRRSYIYSDELFRTVVAKPLAHSVKMIEKAKNKVKKKVIQ